MKLVEITRAGGGSGSVTAYCVSFDMEVAVELVRIPFNESGLNMCQTEKEALKLIRSFHPGNVEFGSIPNHFVVESLENIINALLVYADMALIQKNIEKDDASSLEKCFLCLYLG